MLLEVLSDFQVTIPELGTVTATAPAVRGGDLQRHARAVRGAQAALPVPAPGLPDSGARTRHRAGPGPGHRAGARRSAGPHGGDAAHARTEEGAVGRRDHRLGAHVARPGHRRAWTRRRSPEPSGSYSSTTPTTPGRPRSSTCPPARDGAVGLLDRHVDFVAALRDAGVPYRWPRASTRCGRCGRSSCSTASNCARRWRRHSSSGQRTARRSTRVFDVFYPAVTGEPASAAERTEAHPRSGRGHRGPARGPGRATASVPTCATICPTATSGGSTRWRATPSAASAAVQGRAAGDSSWSRMAVLQRVSAQTLMAGLLEQILAGAGARRARRTAGADDDQRPHRPFREGAWTSTCRRRLAENSAMPNRSPGRPCGRAIDRVDFLGATRTDLVALRREIQPLARKLAARLAIEQRRGAARPVRLPPHDPRVAVLGRHADGDEHRPKRPNKTDLVVLCDVSESVTSFAHFTLLLVYALREQFTEVRAFAFVDELDEVTRFFTPGGDVLEAVTRLAQRGRRHLVARPHRLRPRIRAVRGALPRRDRPADLAADTRRRALELRRSRRCRPSTSSPRGPSTPTGSTRNGARCGTPATRGPASTRATCRWSSAATWRSSGSSCRPRPLTLVAARTASYGRPPVIRAHESVSTDVGSSAATRSASMLLIA